MPDLLRGRIKLFAIDTLINMLATAGLHVELHVAKAAAFTATEQPSGTSDVIPREARY
jgi:hypothetical protein